jgi:drug/metabolite transporter (DMT)-like permease
MGLPADRRVLVAFLATVLLGGTNLVLVVVTTRELDPFWSAGMRFAAAAVLALGAVAVLRLPIPKGRVLAISIAYGALAFFLGFALFYWGTQEVPAGIASVVMGAVPLLTFYLALAQRLERFRLRGLVGACLAMVGIAVISARSPGSLPLVPLLAVFGAAATAGQAAITIRRIREVHPLTVNAVGLATGGALLLATSAVAGESHALPATPEVWAALIVMVVSTPLLFVLFVYVVQRWSASAASYQFALFPLVSILLGSILLDEEVSAALLVGAPLVILGVYVGALAPDRTRSAERAAEPSAG